MRVRRIPRRRGLSARRGAGRPRACARERLRLPHVHAMMGPFATLVQAPFAALGRRGSSPSTSGRAFPACWLRACSGVYLATVARRRGMLRRSPSGSSRRSACVNPLTFEALRSGHPEELLTAALAVGAVAVASEGRELRAALLLGPRAGLEAVGGDRDPAVADGACRRGEFGSRLSAAAVASRPGPAGAARGARLVLRARQDHAASTGRIVDPWNIWYPLAVRSPPRRSTVGSIALTARCTGAAAVAAAVASSDRLAGLAVPLALALRRRRFGLSGADAMALFALLALLRCALDPVGNLYYHEPLLLALLGWDAFSARGLATTRPCRRRTCHVLLALVPQPYGSPGAQCRLLAVALRPELRSASGCSVEDGAPPLWTFVADRVASSGKDLLHSQFFVAARPLFDYVVRKSGLLQKSCRAWAKA